MKLKLYQIDAFTDKIFSGNPAAVCLLNDEWLDDDLMQNIGMENNLSETAFVLNHDGQFHIRWFTPTVEVDLCGHATLAAAQVLFFLENYDGDTISFNSLRSGILNVKKDGENLVLDFPTDTITKVEITDELQAGFNLEPVEAWKGLTDYILIYKSEQEVHNIIVDVAKISRVDARGIIISAPGDSSDFVSRFFAPQSGIAEDPVTGSAHTSLTPYWAQRLKKNELTARQISARGGFLKCNYLGERVEISGKAKLYMRGEIEI